MATTTVKISIKGLASPEKSPKRESEKKNDSNNRKRHISVAIGQSAGLTGLGTVLKKTKRKEEGEKREEEKIEKEKEKDKKEKRENNKNKPKEANGGGDSTETRDPKLKEQLQSMLINGQTATERLHGISNLGVNPKAPPSPLKPILKSPTKRMDISKGPLDNVDTNARKADTQSAPPKSALSKPSKPKKSVKFHSEAAAEDGESRQRIHNALIAAYKASEAAETAAVTPEELANSLDTNAPPAKKQKREKKKEKKEKSKNGGKDENAKQGAVNYMLEYHKHRETWKFQKAKQNWILRNAFDINEIEDTKENGEALKAYIAGLQGQEARNRLLEGAKKILKDGGDSLPKDTAAEGVVRNGEAEKRLARAKQVMIGLGHEDDEENDREGGVTLKIDPKDGNGDGDDDESENSDMTDEGDDSED